MEGQHAKYNKGENPRFPDFKLCGQPFPILTPHPPCCCYFKDVGGEGEKIPPPSQQGFLPDQANQFGHNPESPAPVGAPAASAAPATGTVPAVETDLAAHGASSERAAPVAGHVTVPVAASAFRGDVLLNLVHHRIQKSILFLGNTT